MKRLAALFLAVAALLSFSGIVLAADPPTLSSVVTDQTGKLAGGEARVQAAADALKAERGIDYYVIFLPGLDGEDPSTFIERTAAANGLTDKKVAMLLVTLNDRKIALWSSAQNSISNSELDRIREDEVVPKLKSGDFVGATEVAATGLARWDATTATPGPARPEPSFNPPPIRVDMGAILGVLTTIGLVIIGLFALYFVGRWVFGIFAERQRQRDAAEKMAKLAKEARLTLIKADEEVRDAEQELAFAEAEFGTEELAPYRATLATAKSDLEGAFKTGQEIDDDIPESYEERQAMLKSIVTATTRLTKSLSKQQDYIDGLRRDEQTVADSVKTLSSGSKARQRDLERAQTALDKISAHGASALDAVRNNIEVARAQYTRADSVLTEAQASLDSGVRAKATVLVREATSAIADGKTNLDAIDKVAQSLDEAERSLDAEIATASAEIQKAEAAVKREDVNGLNSDLTTARKALKAAQDETAKPDADFLVAYEQASRANDYADKILDGVRSEVDRRARAKAQAEAQMRQAAAAIEQADAYITSHRKTAGRKARGRLSEAKRQYEQASASGLDIYSAASIAVLANQQANEAYAAARQDVAAESASSYGYSHSSSSSGGYGSSSSSSYGSSHSSSSGSYGSSSSSSDWGSSSSHDSFSIGSFGGGGGGSSSGGGW